MAARLGLPRRRGVLHPLAARSVDSARVRHAGREQDGFIVNALSMKIIELSTGNFTIGRMSAKIVTDGHCG